MEFSILGGIGQLIQPLFTPLGFGSQLTNFGWVFAVAAIAGLVAKENVVSTLGTLAGCLIGAIVSVESDGGVGAVSVMIKNTGITLPALLSFIVFNMTTIPCFAAVAAAKGEMPNKKAFNFTILFWIVTSFIVSSVIYLIGSYWWLSFVYLALAVLTASVIKIINKRKRQRVK